MTNSRLPTVIIAILGILSMVVGLLLSIITPEIRFYALVLIAFGIILVVVAAIVDFRRVRGAVTSRRGKVQHQHRLDGRHLCRYHRTRECH